MDEDGAGGGLETATGAGAGAENQSGSSEDCVAPFVVAVVFVAEEEGEGAVEGSNNQSSSASFADALNPSLVFDSVGKSNARSTDDSAGGLDREGTGHQQMRQPGRRENTTTTTTRNKATYTSQSGVEADAADRRTAAKEDGAENVVELRNRTKDKTQSVVTTPKNESATTIAISPNKIHS